jgi:hypothetical protein
MPSSIRATADGVAARILLLDDSGIGAGNMTIQSIARMFVARMATDEFSVVRLNNRRDEAFGDRLEALMRISEYKSDALPFFGRETVENALKVFARVSRNLEEIEKGRKALVCVGDPAVCRTMELASSSSVMYCYWVTRWARWRAPTPASTRSSRTACRIRSP